MALTRKSRLVYIIAISASLLAAGCAVGPNFKKPAAPTVAGYTPAPTFDYQQHEQRSGRRGATVC